MTAPLIVVPPGVGVEATARRLRESGHRVQLGFVLPSDPFDLSAERLLCAGVVDGEATAVAAVVAAVRQTGLVVSVQLPADQSATFLGDLARIGPVLTPPATPVAPGPALSPEQRQLLDLLAAGASVPEAARQLYLSVRTTERRIGEIRRALGVRTTAEAIVAARQRDVGGNWGSPPAAGSVPFVPMRSHATGGTT